MSNIETKDTIVPIVSKKSDFELSLSKLDLQSTLLLINVLAERALFLQAKPKSILNK